MAEIKKTLEVEFDVSPKEIAELFCDMDSDGQALFFNAIAETTKEWSRPFCFQLQSIIDSEELTTDGRAVMCQIGEYGEVNGKIKICLNCYLVCEVSKENCPECDGSFFSDESSDSDGGA